MKKILMAMLVALGGFALQADEAPWKETLGRV